MEAGPTLRPSAVGRIQGIGIPELLHEISRAGRTGILRLRRPGAEVAVWFEDGRVLHAASDDPDDRLGITLLRERKITIDQLGSGGAFDRAESEQELCTRLLDAGALTRRELDRVQLARARATIATTFSWEDGEYEFHDRPASESPARLDAATSEMIAEGVRRCRSFHVMRGSVGTPQTRYRLAPDSEARLREVTPSEAERLVVETLQRGARAVEEICAELYLSDFEVYQALWMLRVLRAAELAEPVLRADDRGVGRLQEQEFVAVLVGLCREGETGVLHVASAGVDRTFHLKEGSCVFATSSNPDDGLVAHLFRRGVISLKDRDEVDRRMLTNKRVGTILLDLGVIDASDVERMVREQLTEILKDTVRWRSGDFWFAPGELPTLEEITLVGSLEDLVSQAVRTVPSWSRVLRGVGGADACLALSPSYLDVLDRMSVGGDEWDLVALLARPRTVRDICRTSGLGDFSVCQTLWSLQLLGAVVHAEAAAAVAPEPATVEPATSAPAAESEPAPLAAAVEREPVTMAAAVESEPVTMAAAVEPEPVTIAAPSEPEPVEIAADAPAPATQAGGLPGSSEEPLDIPSEPSVEPVLSVPAAAVAPVSEQEPEPQPLSLSLAEPPVSASAPTPAQAEEPPLSDLAAVELAKAPAFELDTPGCTTEPYIADPRQARPRFTEEDRRALDPDVERHIEWLNACQQTVYRVVRAEVGAGAANFVRFCGEKLPDGFGAVFAQVELLDDGSWEASSLRAGLRRERPGDVHAGFQKLIDKELEMVQVHLGAERAAALRRKIGDLVHAPTA